MAIYEHPHQQFSTPFEEKVNEIQDTASHYPNVGPIDRMTSSRVANVFTGLVASLGFFGVGEMATAKNVQANTKPLSPELMAWLTSEFVAENIFSGADDQFILKHEALYPHTLQRQGICPPNDPTSSYTLKDNLSVKGIYAVDCLEGRNGKREVFYAPIKHLTNSSPSKYMDFKPILHTLGEDAAQSAGVNDNQHGQSSHISISMDRHTGVEEAEVFYYRNLAGSGQARSLKVLKLISKKTAGHTSESVSKIWYK